MHDPFSLPLYPSCFLIELLRLWSYFARILDIQADLSIVLKVFDGFRHYVYRRRRIICCTHHNIFDDHGSRMELWASSECNSGCDSTSINICNNCLISCLSESFLFLWDWSYIILTWLARLTKLLREETNYNHSWRILVYFSQIFHGCWSKVMKLSKLRRKWGHRRAMPLQ